MNTTSVPLPHPPGGGYDELSESTKQEQPFHEGDFVLMRSRRISKQEIKRFYDLYNHYLPIETWWSYLSRDYNKLVEFAKDSEDDGGYYMFHNKYIGTVKKIVIKKESGVDEKQYELFADKYKKYFVEWESREEVMPGEAPTRYQEHYPENLMSMSKITIVTKEEMVKEVVEYFLNNQKQLQTQSEDIKNCSEEEI